MLADHQTRDVDPTDDTPALLLAAAVAEVARKDAARGDVDALNWLDELRAHRPKSPRWFIPTERSAAA